MIDLIKALQDIETSTSPEFFNRPPGWTDERLRRWLDSTGEKYAAVKSTRPDRDNGVQYNLSRCPLCQDAEGNPAVWLNSGTPCFKCHRAKHCDGKTFADLQALFKRPKIK